MPRGKVDMYKLCQIHKNIRIKLNLIKYVLSEELKVRKLNLAD